MEIVNRLDFWLAVFTFAALFWYMGGDRLRPIVAPLVQLVRAAAGAAAQRTEIIAEKAEIVSEAVSGIATPEIDYEMIAIEAIAKLIAADLIKETAALTTVFSVKPGSSKDYKRVQSKLREAMQKSDTPTAKTA